MTALRKKSSPRPTSRTSACRTPRVVGRPRRAPQRAHERRPDELALLRVERREKVAGHRRDRDGARRSCRRPSRSRSLGLVSDCAHRVRRARIVEAGEQDQRAVADVPVGVLGDRLQQRRHGLRRRRAPDRAGAPRSACRSRDRPACRWRPGAGRRRRPAGAAGSCAAQTRSRPHRTEDARTPEAVARARRACRRVAILLSSVTVTRMTSTSATGSLVELQRQLQVARLVARKRHRILARCSRSVQYESRLGADGASAARRGSGSRRCRRRGTS